MLFLRAHFVLHNDTLTSVQGDALKTLVHKMFSKKPQLKKGQKYKIDPVRSEWLDFLAAVTYGAFNKCDPHQSGLFVDYFIRCFALNCDRYPPQRFAS